MTRTVAPYPARLRGLRALLAGAGVACVLFQDAPPVLAQEPQWVGVPARSSKLRSSGGALLSPSRPRDPNAQMVVQANELHYDYSGDRVSAVGNVQIHYSGAVLEADRVIYHQKTKVLSAEGNVRLSEADGATITTDRLQLDDQFRNGFVDSLHIETADKTRFAAARADVQSTEGGRITVFQSGVYTACEPCKENPAKPPKWQVRAARIIHDEAEKTIYYEDAAFELFGQPIAYLPYFWTPDPTVKKKSGFLAPRIISGSYIGFGLQPQYFFNLAPDYDLTVAPAYLTRQGLLMAGEWRQRLINGAYWIRGVGIFQQDKDAFLGTTGYRDFRGAIETRGDFRLAQNWWYGWDASIFTDNSFTPQYKVTRQGQEAVSQAYLFGRGVSSYFDLRAIYFYGLSPLDIQKQLPVLHPLLDYKYRFASPILGGELSYNVNMASLNRKQADFDLINPALDPTITGVPSPFADGLNVCDTTSVNAAGVPVTVNGQLVPRTRQDCLLRGIPGTYSRLSAEAVWKRTVIDPFGQIFTPFIWARGDVAAVSVTPDAGVSNFIQTGDQGLARVMPAVGIDYRYPFISAHAWGTQIIEPRAQLIARPNESQIGKFPNEDAQSLLFGDDNLFSISKFPGYDRVEGGGRANVGLQYTAQFNQGGYVNALFGQSYQLFGDNSYFVAPYGASPYYGDMSNTGSSSGLDTARSDYVARMTYKPNSTYTFTSRFRFDEQNFDTRRLEVEGSVNFDRWTASLTYGQYDAQPYVGLLLPREGILPSATFKFTQNWSVRASALYSIDSSRLNTFSVGAGYIDECIALSATYSENFGYRGDIVPNRTFLLQLSLRTLGGTAISQTVGGPGGGNQIGF